MFCIVDTFPERGYLPCKYQCKVCEDYQAGRTKPAYPVPAIPLDVDLQYGIIWNAYPWDRPNEPMIAYCYATE